MKIIESKLEGQNIFFDATKNIGGKFHEGMLDTIIIHYTAGASAESSVRTLKDPKTKASAHLVIGQKGEVTQLVPFDTVAWHAGKSQYGGRVGFNKYSIGIEIDNPGVLTKTGNVYRSWFGKTYEEKDVIKAIHRNESVEKYWHTYTFEQIQKVEEICKLLIEKYNIKYILGHEEIAPTRKTDPGPAFPLDKMREHLLNSNRDEETAEELPPNARVIASKLNIRNTPDTKGELIMKPIPNGKKVKILEKSGSWYKVAVETEGWVFGEYLELDK